MAVICCAAGPFLVGLAGSLAVGAALGLGAGVVALLGVLACSVLRARRKEVPR